MDTFFTPKSDTTDDGKLSSGVFMTVWQSMPQRPEVAMLMRQQEEIAQLKSKIQEHEIRLTLVEQRLAELQEAYVLFTAKVDRFLKKIRNSKSVLE